VKRVLILTDLTPASREACRSAVDWLAEEDVHTTVGFIHPSLPPTSGLLIRVEQVYLDQTESLRTTLGAQATLVCTWGEMQQRIRGKAFDLVALTAGAPQGLELPASGGPAIPEHFIHSWGIPVLSFPSNRLRRG
jgi:hypothetical protein